MSGTFSLFPGVSAGGLAFAFACIKVGAGSAALVAILVLRFGSGKDRE